QNGPGVAGTNCAEQCTHRPDRRSCIGQYQGGNDSGCNRNPAQTVLRRSPAVEHADDIRTDDVFVTGRRTQSIGFSESVSNWASMLGAGRGCKELRMYPVYQFCVSDGRSFKIVPVPAIDPHHAEIRAQGWCAGTPWRVVGRIDSNFMKSVPKPKT